jgi:hypothetical protein
MPLINTDNSTSTLPSQQSVLTIADLNAVIQSNTNLAHILEQINEKLEPLEEIRELSTYLKNELVNDVVRRAVVDKQLDITNEQSKLALSIKDSYTLLSSVAGRLKWAIVALILCTTLLGGVSLVNNFLSPSARAMKTTSVTSPIYHFDVDGRAYVISRLNDTLWISPEKPK